MSQSSPAKIRAVVFDMDGVMFDTEPIYFEAEDAMLQRRGQRYSHDLARQVMGMPGPLAARTLVKLCSLSDDPDVIFQEVIDEFTARLADELVALPGLFELLDLLEQLGLRKAVATSTQQDLAARMLDQFDLVRRMEFVLGGDEVEHGKPSPDIYIEACRRLELPPENVLVLEDSPNGAKAAVLAGCCCLAVPQEANLEFDFGFCQGVLENLQDPALRPFLAH